MSRGYARHEQARQAEQPTGLEHVFKAVVEETLRQLADRPAPVPARFLRTEAASRYIGRHDEFLTDDRREASRLGRKPMFPFKRIGSTVLYDVRALDRVMDSLPEFGGASMNEQKLDQIVAACMPLERDTGAWKYLESRGINPASLPADVMRQPNAMGGHGAVVVLLRDDAGNVVGAHRIFVERDGRKAPANDYTGPKAKRSYGSIKGNVFVFPGEKGPPIVAEGFETAASIAQAVAGKHPVWCSLASSSLAVCRCPLGRRLVSRSSMYSLTQTMRARMARKGPCSASTGSSSGGRASITPSPRATAAVTRTTCCGTMAQKPCAPSCMTSSSPTPTRPRSL